VGKTTVIYVTFLHDVACQKFSKNKTGTVFLRHGVHIIFLAVMLSAVGR